MPSTPTARLTVALEGRSWSVRHNGGALGHVATREEAVKIATGLVNWIVSDGRAAELLVEEPTRPTSLTRARLS